MDRSHFFITGAVIKATKIGPPREHGNVPGGGGGSGDFGVFPGGYFGSVPGGVGGPVGNVPKVPKTIVNRLLL